MRHAAAFAQKALLAGFSAALYVSFSAGLPSPATAQDMPLECFGTDPDWALEIADGAASFTHQQRHDMEIPQSTQADRRDWPKALTLIAPDQTAIVILDAKTCSTTQITDYPITAYVLTQTGETPIILHGCCTKPPRQ